MTCMSEEQRYSKEGRAGWDPSVGQGNKGEKRQNAWIANLRKILQETSDLDGDVKNILDTIQEHENIPRKKPKFVNFVKNIMRNRARPHSIDKTWELFEQALKPPALPEPMEVAENGESDKTESLSIAGSETNGKEKTPENTDVEDTSKEKKKKKKKDKKNEVNSNTTDVEMNGKENTPETEEEEGRKEKKKKKKEKKLLGSGEAEASDTTKSRKRKNSETGEDEESSQNDVETVSKKAKFDWDEVITGCLKGKSGNEMKMRKVRKMTWKLFRRKPNSIGTK